MSAAWQNRRPACLAGSVGLDTWLNSTFGGGRGTGVGGQEESAVDCGQQSDPMPGQSAANSHPPGGACWISRTLGMPVVMAHTPLLLRSPPGAPHGARSETKTSAATKTPTTYQHNPGYLAHLETWKLSLQCCARQDHVRPHPLNAPVNNAARDTALETYAPRVAVYVPNYGLLEEVQHDRSASENM